MIITSNDMAIKQESQVLEHLYNFGTITSMEAWERYGITRLSSVIFRLRKRYNIETVATNGVNRDGMHCRFATYFFRGVK